MIKSIVFVYLFLISSCIIAYSERKNQVVAGFVGLPWNEWAQDIEPNLPMRQSSNSLLLITCIEGEWNAPKVLFHHSNNASSFRYKLSQ